MQLRILALAGALLLGGAVLACWLRPAQVRTGPGPRQVTVTSGASKAIFEAAPTEESFVLLLVGGHAGRELGIFGGSLAGWGPRQVEALRRQYGDFRRCDSSGAAEAQATVAHLRLVGQTGNALKALGPALRSVYAGKEVWVGLHARHLALRDFRSFGLETHLNDEAGILLVRELQVISPPDHP